MKKRLFMLMAVFILGVSIVSGCGKDSDNSDKKKAETEADKSEKAKELADYEDVVYVLCDSKAKNDVDEFLLLFDYMKGLMKSVVTDDDVFTKISEGYKEECGDNFKWSYDITEAEKVTEESLEEYQEAIQVFGSDGEITEAYELTAEVTIKGSEGSIKNTLEITVGKIEDKWQIVNFNDTLLK